MSTPVPGGTANDQRSRRRYFVWCFLMGLVLSRVGALTAGALLPLLLAWRVVAFVAGSRFADTHVWIAEVIASVSHGVAAVLLGWLVDLLLERWGRRRVRTRVKLVLVAVAYLIFLLLAFPVRPEQLP
jgi:hypothetical protein